MNKVVSFLRQYLVIISVLVGISILLSVTFSNFIVTSNNHKAAEMYIGELKYSMEIDETTTNTLSVPSGETIVDITITNENPIDTYYKLIYQNNSNISIKYYESTKDTNDNVTNYSSPNDKVTSNNTNTIKLKITNNSTSSQKVTFKIVGGFSTNTLDDVTVPTGYTTINTIETPSPNTYFCTTADALVQGLQYVNGQYTYAYKQEGGYASSGLAWNNISNNGWGVQLTDKASTNAVTSKVCTYINNVPITSMSYMFSDSKATTLDVSNFDTSNVTNMSKMFSYSKATTLDVSNFNTSNVTYMNNMFRNSKATTLDVSNFDTSKVTNMMNMFQGSSNLKTIYGSSKFVTTAVTNSTDMFKGATSLVGGAGTKYNSSYVDKTYARIDGGTSNPGYFTSIPEPNSFSSDSWMTIAKAVKSGNISKYNVGNTKTVNLGTYGTHILRIANMSTPSECSTTGFSQTACGFVLEFADIITTHKMNDTQTNVGGWPATSMRTFVNNDIYNSLPSELKNAIIDTTVVSSHGSGDTSNFTSTDKLYLLAPKEIYTDFSDSYDTSKDLTRILDYYKNVGVTNNNYSGAIKKKGTDNYFWWLRAAYYTRDYSTFYNIHHVGAWNSSILASNSNGGVSPAFRLG